MFRNVYGKTTRDGQVLTTAIFPRAIWCLFCWKGRRSRCPSPTRGNWNWSPGIADGNRQELCCFFTGLVGEHQQETHVFYIFLPWIAYGSPVDFPTQSIATSENNTALWFQTMDQFSAIGMAFVDPPIMRSYLLDVVMELKKKNPDVIRKNWGSNNEFCLKVTRILAESKTTQLVDFRGWYDT